MTIFSTNDRSLNNFRTVFMLKFLLTSKLDLFSSSDGMSAGKGATFVGPFKKFTSVSVDILRIFNVFLKHANQFPGQYIIFDQKSFL